MQGMLMASMSMLETSKSITRSIDRKSPVPPELWSIYTKYETGTQTSIKERISGEGRCRVIDNTGRVTRTEELAAIYDPGSRAS